MDRSDRRAILKTLLLLCNIIKFLLTNMNITALSEYVIYKLPNDHFLQQGGVGLKQIVVTSNVLQKKNR